MPTVPKDTKLSLLSVWRTKGENEAHRAHHPVQSWLYGKRQAWLKHNQAKKNVRGPKSAADFVLHKFLLNFSAKFPLPKHLSRAEAIAENACAVTCRPQRPTKYRDHRFEIYPTVNLPTISPPSISSFAARICNYHGICANRQRVSENSFP